MHNALTKVGMSQKTAPKKPPPQLKYNIWCLVLAHVKRPLPPLGAPVGRKGWHQTDLVACMQVSKTFNAIASRLLYTDPVVSDVWSFGSGASLTPENRIGKAVCLAYVKRIFHELPEWEAPVPDDGWQDVHNPEAYTTYRLTQVETTFGVFRFLDHADRQEASTKELVGPAPGPWATRTIQGLDILAKFKRFKPGRVVFEAFLRPTLHGRIATWSKSFGIAELDADPTTVARKVFEAYGHFVKTVEPASVCCWTGQMLEFGLEDLVVNAPLHTELIKHFGYEDGYVFVAGNMLIRFKSPWFDEDGAVNDYVDPDTLLENAVFIRSIDRAIETHASIMDEVMAEVKGRAAGLAATDGEDTWNLWIGITPWFPGIDNPFGPASTPRGIDSPAPTSTSLPCDMTDSDVARSPGPDECGPRIDDEADEAGSEEDVRQLGGPEEDGEETVSQGTPSSAASSDRGSLSDDSVEIDGEQLNHKYERYMSAWQDWCDKLNRTGNGKSVKVYMCWTSACDVCGEDPPNPEDLALVDYIDEEVADDSFAVLDVDEAVSDESENEDEEQ